MADSEPAIHDTGVGPAILFLHGFPLDASQWDHQVAALGGDYRCLRPDMWGCGSSPPPPAGEPSLDAYAEQLLRTLDARGVETFSVVGLSMGGYIAFSILRLALSRVSALVLANTRATDDPESGRDNRLALAQRVLDARSVESLVEPNVDLLLGPRARTEVHVTDPVRARIRRCSPAGVAYAARAMAARPDSSSMLPSATVPTLVVAGLHDAVITSRETRTLAAAIPHARLVEMECGHLANLEEPERFTEHLHTFFASQTA